WWNYLEAAGFTEDDLLIRDLMDSTDFGESIRHVSAFAALAEYAESSPYNEMDLKIKGGNGMLIEKMADAVGRENILLNHAVTRRSEEHTSELQSRENLVCRLLLEKKK